MALNFLLSNLSKESKSFNKSNFDRIIGMLFLLFFTISNAQKKRDFLTIFTQKDILKPLDSVLYEPIKKKDFHGQLVSLPEAVKQKIISDADEAITFNWPHIPATAYLDFKRSGERYRMEKFWTDGLTVIKKLVLAEILQGEGKYIDAIANGSWAVCEQSTWVLSAHLPSQKGGAGIPNINDPIIDLGSGEVSSSLAWVYYFFKDDFEKISPFLKARIPYEINRRIISPYTSRNDFWWLGFQNEKFVNNWNPWCNYNVLLSTLLLGEEISPKTRQEVLQKSMRSVDKFINYYKEDGVCEEGPAYWTHAGAKMMEYLELLKTYSGGKISLSNEPLIKNMGTYIIDAHIDKDYYINFADSSVRVQTDPGTVFRYGNYVNDASLREFGSFLAHQNEFFSYPISEYLDSSIHNIGLYPMIKATRPNKKVPISSWFKDNEVAKARTQEDFSKGFFFAAKGGYNDESHNHNDVGSFILYHDGTPLLADIGVETYSSKTFGSKRYEIWTMQSDYHNLPIINGFSQKDGKEFKASQVSFKASNSEVHFDLNIAGAYPIEASCDFWKRNFTLKRKSNPKLIIEENYLLKEHKGENQEHFIATQLPILVTAGKLKLKNQGTKSVFLYYPEALFEMKIEELPLKDLKLLTAWKQEKLYRIILTNKSKSLQNAYQLKIEEN